MFSILASISLTQNHRMHNLFAIFVKILEIAKQFSCNIVILVYTFSIVCCSNMVAMNNCFIDIINSKRL